jgi:hypothetical protein
VLLGRCDINKQGTAQDKTLTRGWDLFNTGVTVDRDVGQGAAIMASSVLLYGIVQVGRVMMVVVVVVVVVVLVVVDEHSTASP